jgi:hypothetical protein
MSVYGYAPHGHGVIIITGMKVARRLWNAIADVACTGVTCERMGCLLVGCPMAKVRVILLRRLWNAIVDVSHTGMTCE